VQFVLIHSPLVGPDTWQPVAIELEQRGAAVRVPHLRDNPAALQTVWEQHAAAVAHALAHTPVDTPLVWVAHSGAGPLLPALRHAVPHRAAGYIFVDASIPRAQTNRLQAMRDEDAAWVDELETALRNGARFPDWDDELLREEVPDAAARDQLVAGLTPRGLDFFQEPLPVFDGFPDAPCAYLQFSAAYDSPAHKAQTRGWTYRRLRGGHFHMLVQPAEVAQALLDLANSMKASAA